MIFDVSEADFAQRVVERSRERPVVVDFWAAWCGPCRALTPALETAAKAREGSVDLAKVDVDRNQALAARFRVQGIPAVKAFQDGGVVDEFTGALPPPQVERFFDKLVPSEADRLMAGNGGPPDEATLKRALEHDPTHAGAARSLARLLLSRGEPAEALEVVGPVAAQDFEAGGLAARARLSMEGDRLRPAFEAWDRNDHETALEQLQEAFAGSVEGEKRDLIRQVMIAIFTELGPDHPLAREHRRRLSASLY